MEAELLLLQWSQLLILCILQKHPRTLGKKKKKQQTTIPENEQKKFIIFPVFGNIPAITTLFEGF